MRIPHDRETLELILKEPNSFGIHPETAEGRELYHRVEAKHWRLYGRREYEETHEPFLELPRSEVKWLEETGRIHVLKRIIQQSPSYTIRNGEEVKCVMVRVASWTEAYKAYKMAWAKFQLPSHNKR